MTVIELIEKLEEFRPNQEVIIFDQENEVGLEIESVDYSPADNNVQIFFKS